MKSKKELYYAFTCPDCDWKAVGNWKDKLFEEYLYHCADEHYHDPIIKKGRR